MLRVLALASVMISVFGSTTTAEPYAFSIVDGARVPLPLGNLTGDPLRGVDLIGEHCAACHGAALPIPRWETERLRLAIIDLGVFGNEATPHAFYTTGNGERSALTAQQIEDILAALGDGKP